MQLSNTFATDSCGKIAWNSKLLIVKYVSLESRYDHRSHAHTVVWECCKDENQSQWGMAKFDPQPMLNPWTDRHQIWNTWLRRGLLLPKKFGLNPPWGFCPQYTRNIHPKPSNIYLTFFQYFRAPTEKAVGPIFAHNTSYDVILRKEVPLGVEKN